MVQNRDCGLLLGMAFALLAKGIREGGGFNFLFSILSCFYFFAIERWPSMTDRLMTRPLNLKVTGPRSAVGNVSGNRCESDCRSRGREFDPGPVPYFLGD